MNTIDLNGDMGEGFGNYRMGNDQEIMKYITTANIACGFHASDPCIMSKTVELAKQNGVEVGAHPGFPDLQGFGRRLMKISEYDLRCDTIYQVGALKAFVEAAGSKLHHVKAHGSLSGAMHTDEQLSQVFADAIIEIDPNLLVYFPAPLSQALPRIAKAKGLRVIGEAYVDLEYAPNGTLIIQREKHVLDPDIARQKIRKFITKGTATAINGEDVKLDAESICVHGDTPNAVEIILAIRDELNKAGIAIASIRRA
ncbi:LamB/YcsF family protein [Chloroflexota bacterium]